MAYCEFIKALTVKFRIIATPILTVLTVIAYFGICFCTKITIRVILPTNFVYQCQSDPNFDRIWLILQPQESTKSRRIQYEQEPWRCLYCNSALVRFAQPLGLRRHISTLHHLKKEICATLNRRARRKATPFRLMQKKCGGK